ncbi:hypothetical protein RJ639_043322, partial [Escallonia herrerae]
MAAGASMCLSLSLLSIYIVCSSGTLVGFFYDARRSNAISSAAETVSFLRVSKVPPSQIRVLATDHRVLDSFWVSNTDVHIDLYLNHTQVENLRIFEPCAISWLKSLLITSTPHVKIKNIVVNSNSNDSPGRHQLPLLVSTLKSIRSILGSFHLDREVAVSVAFPLQLLENLNKKYERDLQRISDFIYKARSSVIVAANVDGVLSMGDQFIESVTKSATLAASALPHTDVSMVLMVKSSAVPSALELAEFGDKISRSLDNGTQITGRISGLFAGVSLMNNFEKQELQREEEQMFHLSHRDLSSIDYKSTHRDSVYPPTTVFPTTPITNPVTTPVVAPSDNPAPIVVTVPSTNPIPVTPNPSATPVTVPAATPVQVPPTNPTNSPVPVTNPVTTPSTVPPAVTNPVTTYPAPSGVPVTTPATNPVTPPAATNSPAVPGQSWCVVKSGAMESAIQSALDYACGIGGADCSTIQQGGSCYNPNTLQNHASYAFNSYYQKNPVQTSCEFGGAAMLTNTNPSTGSCIYPSSSSSSSVPTTASPTPTTTSPTPNTSSPVTTSPTPTPTTSSSSGAAPIGYGSPPSVLNASNPASGTGTTFGDSPPTV